MLKLQPTFSLVFKKSKPSFLFRGETTKRFFYIYDEQAVVSSSTKLVNTHDHEFPSLLKITRQDADHFRPVYNTPTHKHLYELLFLRARNLSQDIYIGQCGTSSCMVNGARGIGKSTTFRNFTNLLPSFYPNVIPIYVNYGCALESELLQNSSLLECVLEELNIVHGLSLENTSEYEKKKGTVYLVNRLLREKGKYVILMVDELDKLYELDPQTFPKSVKTMGELAGLGDGRAGRIAVVLCSSVSILPDLVNAKARSLGYSNDYPLLRVAPNLNGSKFMSLRLPTSPPTDIQVVRNILINYGFEDRLDLVKQVTFLTGCVPRSIDALLGGSWAMGILTKEGLSNRNISDECSQLWSNMMASMYKKNLGLIQALSNHPDGINIEQVIKMDWPNEFSPLTIEEIGSIWREIEANKQRDSFNEIYKDLFCLHDNDLIYFRPTFFGTIEHVYPFDMLHLFSHPIVHPSTLRTAIENSVQKIREGVSILKSVGINTSCNFNLKVNCLFKNHQHSTNSEFLMEIHYILAIGSRTLSLEFSQLTISKL